MFEIVKLSSTNIYKSSQDVEYAHIIYIASLTYLSRQDNRNWILSDSATLTSYFLVLHSWGCTTIVLPINRKSYSAHLRYETTRRGASNPPILFQAP